jgi:hypothetical protein
MYEHPQTSKQLVDERLEAGRRYVADRRLAGLTRENRQRRRAHFSMPWANWFGDTRQNGVAAKPTTA